MISIGPGDPLTQGPYPGLRPFSPSEADVFFGRDPMIDRVLEKIRRDRFVAVAGESGCGKSSLIRAGVIPALEANFLGRAGTWRFVLMRPGNGPIRALAHALIDSGALGPSRTPEAEEEAFLEASLRRSPRALIEVLREAGWSRDEPLLLLVDQFEELFRYRLLGDRDTADAFVALLLESAGQPEWPITVVLTLRSDFVGDCGNLAGLAEAVADGLVLVPRMSRDQRREAIEGPARVYGGLVEPALVNRLLNETWRETDHLPLLQHVLMRLWQRAITHTGDGHPSSPVNPVLGLSEYQAIGGVAGALSRHADEIFSGLGPSQQRLAELVFCSLVDRDPGRLDVRRPCRLSELAAVAETSLQAIAEVVEVFRAPGALFLSPPAPIPLEPETVIDIQHEALVRQWARLRNWIDREAITAATFRRLADDAGRWRRGEAAPPRGLDLEWSSAWLEREHPTAVWANRYGGDLELVRAFLESGRAERDRERQRSQRRLSILLIALLAIFIMAIAMSFALGRRSAPGRRYLVSGPEPLHEPRARP